ncbi:MAG: hypothetical protein ABII22_00815 [Candidatus Micrarchaeota archaeon]
MKNEKKGQAAIDFLMTYGWAIVLIILVAAALFALGIFDTGSFVGNKAAAFTEIQVVGFKLVEDGTLTVKLQNQVGKTINIDTINATYSNVSIESSPAVTNLGVGKSTGTLTVGDLGTFTKGTSFKVDLNIGYTDVSSGFTYSEAGTLNGVVQ